MGDTTKSDSSNRSLPLVPMFREKLLEVREEQEYYRKLCGRSFNAKESRYVYTDQLGNRIKPGYLTSAFPQWLEKNGFNRLRYHDLRHSCASLLLASGVSMKEIQAWLGHSNFAITADLYTHLDASSKDSVAAKATWINQTSMAQNMAPAAVPDHLTPVPENNMQTLPDVLCSLLGSGVPVQILQAWLQQNDFASTDDVKEQFAVFMQSWPSEVA